MEPAIRVAVALVNAGRPEEARDVLAVELDDHPIADPLPDGASIEELTAFLVEAVDGIDVDPGDAQPVRVDSTSVGADDLTLDELARGARDRATLRGDIDPDAIDRVVAWIRDADGTVEADRLRLLVEDYLFRPADRPVVIDRLEQLVARDRRRDRDVTGLFDR